MPALVTLYDLSSIRSKVRILSGHRSENDITDADMNTRINEYYQFNFPIECRPLELRSWFEFSTSSGDEYATNVVTDPDGRIFDDFFCGIEFPITIDGYDLNLYLDPAQFYDKWPETTTYDQGFPEDVLYYDKKLLFRYPPDDIYDVKFATWRRPDALDLTSNPYPMMKVWGPVIAYGTAIELANEYGDFETVQRLTPNYERHKADLGSIVLQQQVNQRAMPRF